MIATKPNPAAAPFPRPYARYRAAPEPPPSPLADASPPRLPLVTYSCLATPHGRFGFCLPVQQSTPPVLRKGVRAAPWQGRPPHKLTAAFSGPGGAGKRPARAAVAILPAAFVSTHVPAAPRKLTTAQQINAKSRSTSQAKAPWTRKVAVPRARLAAKLKPSELGEASTTKKISERMMKLLNEHGWRMNMAAMVATMPNPAAAPSPRPYEHYRAAPEPPPFPLADACPPRLPLVTFSCLASPRGRLGFCYPVQKSDPLALRKGVLAAPWHGRPPHKFTPAFSRPCGVGKRLAAAMLPAASVPTQLPAAPRKTRTAQLKAKRRRKSHGMKPKPSELDEASTIRFRNIPNTIT